MDNITCEELLEFLMRPRLDLSQRLRIPVKGITGSIGPRKSIGVKAFSQGFDWDKGNLFLLPDEELSPYGDSLKRDREHMHNLSEGIASINMICSYKGISDSEKLRNVKKILKDRGFKYDEI